jgi:putative endonuclease
METTVEKGARAEREAERFYLAKGYVLLARNFRRPCGEIDLIFRRGEVLLFVEVKGRGEFRDCEPWLPRWREKKRKLRRVVGIFLAGNREALADLTEIRLEIVFVTQGRVTRRFEGEPFF